MSFILKALQKVEEEKAAQRAKPQDINRAILTADTPAPRAARLVPAATVVVLLLLAGGGLAYLLLPRESEPVRKPMQAAMPHEDRAASPRMPSAASSLPVQFAERSAATKPTVTLAESPDKTSHVDITAPAKTSPAVKKPAPVASPRTEQPGQAESYGPPPPGLKVNGIALQDNPAESVAVVNGLLVHRGAIVQGMKVEEILSDRVRFSGSGGKCQVLISK
jgi:general secretion pathway protein B